GTRSVRSWRRGSPRRGARRTGSDRGGSWWTSLLGFAIWWEGDAGCLGHGADEALFGARVFVEQTGVGCFGWGLRIVEGGLPVPEQAADLGGRDAEGADDVLELAALVEHAEGLGGDVAGRLQAAHAAVRGGADYVRGVVAPDAGGVAFRPQLASQAHVVDRGHANAEL